VFVSIRAERLAFLLFLLLLLGKYIRMRPFWKTLPSSRRARVKWMARTDHTKSIPHVLPQVEKRLCWLSLQLY
jgi:hypothetical protein